MEPTLSGAEIPAPVITLPAALRHLVSALNALAAPDMPAIAVIGGMAVNIRLSTADTAHRATLDIDVVADQDTPTAVEILSRGHEVARANTVVVGGIEVDVIETHSVSADDLSDLDDESALFIVAHRWALETAQPLRIVSLGADGLAAVVPVATPAGLVAAKSHAAGYPRAARRSTKHGGDLYDIFRLIEVFDRRSGLRTQLAEAPGRLGQLIASVVQTEILTNPTRAMRQMTYASSTALSVDRIVDVIEPFVAALR
jgi:hypothetical protein